MVYNEICVNIGNMFFNWCMLEVMGDVKYVDIVEIVFYNSVLSGVSLDGKKYFYINLLCISVDLLYIFCWFKECIEYISCFCCLFNMLCIVC